MELKWKYFLVRTNDEKGFKSFLKKNGWQISSVKLILEKEEKKIYEIFIQSTKGDLNKSLKKFIKDFHIFEEQEKELDEILDEINKASKIDFNNKMVLDQISLQKRIEEKN